MLVGDDRSKSRVPVSEPVEEFALRRIGSGAGYGRGAIPEPLHLGVGCRPPTLGSSSIDSNTAAYALRCDSVHAGWLTMVPGCSVMRESGMSSKASRRNPLIIAWIFRIAPIVS